MRKLIAIVLCGALMVAGWDYYKREQRRKNHGEGYELRHGQPVKAMLAQDLIMTSLKPGDDLYFKAQPANPIGSTAIGDAILMDALLVARVVKCGYSETLKHQAVVFEFYKLQLPSGKSYTFKGSIFSEDDPAHVREAPMIGSFVGMEYGPMGIIGGFLLGTAVPYYYGRNFAAPLNYSIRDIRAGGNLWIKVHYADFIPLKIKTVASNIAELGVQRNEKK